MAAKRTVKRTRRRGFCASFIRRVANDQMGSVMIAMLVALCILLCYIGVYAKVTKNGFYRSSLTAQLREARVENQRLRADIQMLSCPDQLALVAVEAGMQPCEEFDYLRARQPIVIADAGQE